MPESQPDPESENGFSRAQAASEAQVQAEFWKCWSSFLGMRRTMKEKEKKFFFFLNFSESVFWPKRERERYY